MKITRLQIKNFRIHKDSVLDLSGSSFVCVRGPNYAGKSSIGQALSMCLTPSTMGLDPVGRGFASKIKRGESKAEITAQIETKRHVLERTVTLNTNSSGRTPRSICLNDPGWNVALFEKHLDQNRAALTVALNTDAFQRMDEKEQKNLLAGLALPRRYEFDREVVARVKGMGSLGIIDFEGEPLAAINMAYKKLFDERQVVNRQVRDFVVPEALAVPAQSLDSQALQEQLATLREARRQRAAERDAAVAGANKAEVARARARAKMQQMEASLDDDQRRAEEIRESGRLAGVPEAGATCPTCRQLIGQEAAGLILQMELEAIEAEVAEKQRKLTEAQAELPETQEFDFQPYDLPIAEADQEIERLSALIRPAIVAEERQKEIVVKREQLARLVEKAAQLDGLVKYFGPDGIKATLIGEYIGAFEQKINEVMGAWGYRCQLSMEPYSFNITNARGDTIPVRELSGAERIMFLAGFQCAVARSAGLGLVVIDDADRLLPEIRPALNRCLYETLQNGYLDQVILLAADTSEEVPKKLAGASFWMVKDGTIERL